MTVGCGSSPEWSSYSHRTVINEPYSGKYGLYPKNITQKIEKLGYFSYQV